MENTIETATLTLEAQALMNPEPVEATFMPGPGEALPIYKPADDVGFVASQPEPTAEAAPMEKVYQGFEVKDMKAADWACRKVVRYMELKKQVDDYVKEEIAKLKEYQERMDADYDDHINYLTEKLRPFAEAQIEGTKKKSFRLPSGLLQFTTGYDVTKDEEKLLKYVQANAPEYVKCEPSVKWGDFKKQLTWTPAGVAVTPDGEVLDFVSRTEKKSFAVKL